jgi:hypothetical protein
MIQYFMYKDSLLNLYYSLMVNTNDKEMKVFYKNLFNDRLYKLNER